mmetsp:Transcript_71738/g.171410  ORF Transcript_71738/g.171410 Transcript_71738/m.171410 type:complete len:252 (-) Transcript_71738:318-1073(-)
MLRLISGGSVCRRDGRRSKGWRRNSEALDGDDSTGVARRRHRNRSIWMPGRRKPRTIRTMKSALAPHCCFRRFARKVPNIKDVSIAAAKAETHTMRVDMSMSQAHSSAQSSSNWSWYSSTKAAGSSSLPPVVGSKGGQATPGSTCLGSRPRKRPCRVRARLTSLAELTSRSGSAWAWSSGRSSAAASETPLARSAAAVAKAERSRKAHRSSTFSVLDTPRSHLSSWILHQRAMTRLQKGKSSTEATRTIQT